VRPAIFGRRRVDEFAQAVADLNATSQPDADSERADTPELQVVQALSAARADDFAPQPSDQFRQQLRATLIAAAERGIGATAAVDEPTSVLPLGLVKANGRRGGGLRKSRRARRTRAAVIVGLAAGTLAISGISVASGSAGPGDPLYGVKISGENARIALAGSDRDRGALYLQFARNRMSEASGTSRAAALSDLFVAMDKDTTQASALLSSAALAAHDASMLDPLTQFVADQRRDLNALSAQRLTADSLSLVNRVAARIAAIREAIGCHAAFVDTGDPLGPTVGPCP
jgi:hypothetical protein